MADPLHASAFSGLAGLATGALLALVFGGGLFVAGRAFRAARRAAGLKAAHPDEPWLHRPEWAGGRIRDSAHLSAVTLGILAAAWLVLSLVILFAVFGDGSSDPLARAVAAGFTLIGVVLAGFALREVLRLRKFGRSTFELADTPGVIGGTLGGLLFARLPTLPRSGVQLRLQSIHRRSSGAGKQRTTREHLLWEDAARLPPEKISTTSRRRATIPVYFEIPYTCEPARRADADNEYLWRLRAEAAFSGLDYRTCFEVPVFRTAASDPGFQARAGGGTASTPIAEEVWRARGIRLHEGPEAALTMDIPGFGRALLLLPGVVLGAGFLALTVFLHSIGAPILVQGLVALLGALFLAGCLGALFTRVRLEADRNGITVTRKCLGFTRRRLLAAANFDRAIPAEGINYGGTPFHNLSLLNRKGRHLSIGLGLKSLVAVQDLCRRIENAVRP
ncbi:MAG: hypothetical protein EA425_09535 [Puniceicoccaceae bacterium]|nr:MAG: hypothetical protein EA425_09535 [Puniceicoccaceae bacterium]